MLWRHLLQTRRNSDEARSAQPSASPAPIGFSLEARMMFDGAIAATVNQAENAQPTADAAATAASATTTVANSDSAHAGDGTQTQHTESQDNQKTQGTTDNHTDSDTHAASDITAAGENTRKEVVFIDTSLTDYKTLVDNVPAGIEVELFDGSKDGLSQLVQWAQSHSGYDAIHILSHGGEGEVQLGTLTLDSATATARAADLATLGSALTESGDLLLYGCDVAENTGQSFVSLLAQLTGADIAASSDLTGDSAQGGDWTLESHTGSIEAAALHVDGYQHLLDVSDTNVEYVLNGISYSTSPVGAGVEVFLDLMPDTDTSLWYVDIDPTTSTITMTMRDGVPAYTGLTGFQLNFSGSTLDAITSITKDNAGTTSAADISASVNGNDKTISFHINTDETSGDGVLVWHFTSTNNTLPTVSGTASNPTFTENGAAVGLFSGVTADTHDTGQTFTGALLTVSNVSANTEYLTIHGVNVALSNGNSILLGGSYGTASVSLSGGIATITLSGATLSNADMSSLLSGITYGNSSDNPGNTTRVVTLTQLTDSGTSNNTVAPNISSAVTVVPVNDAPTGITLSSTAFGQSTGSNAVVATLTATDVDSSAFTYSLVSGAGDTDNARFTLLGDTLRVNASGMSAGTYSVRLQVSDGQATFDKVVLLTVVDDIAPTFDQAPAISNATSGGFTISGSVTEASTLYYVVVLDGDNAPTAFNIIAGQNAGGHPTFAYGYQSLNAPAYDFALALSGLAASTMYDVYVVAKDSANNTSSVVKMDAATTSAGHAPGLSATGSNTVFIGGMAGSVDLFSGVISSTNDSGQTFSSMTLRVEGLSNSGEFINVGGTNLSLDGGDSGTLSGIGKYTIFRTGNFAILVLSELNASSEQINGLVDGLRYGNNNENVTAGIRQVTLVNISDSGSSNNSTVVNISASVNVLASNAALYVTSGSDTGDDAGFGGSIQDDVNDGGGLSLREALYWANQTPGVDRIVFQTDVTLARSIIVPTETMLIDGQSFTLNGGGYSGFQIVTSSITFAIQNLTLTNFTTENNGVSGGVIGFQPNLFGANLRLYNVDMSNNIDNGWGNGIIDMFNLGAGTFNFDFDRVNFHDNILYGVANGDAVIRLFVSGTMQTVSMSITNTAFVNNNQSVYTDPTSTGNAALDFMGNQANPVNTFITLNNVTITGQKHGIIFDYLNNAKIWNLTVRNSVINATDVAMVMNNDGSGTSPTLNVLGTNNLIGTNVLNQLTATDPRLAANAANAINQGDLFYVTGDTDVRGLNRTRQGGVDIGAYESQFAAGTAPQIDLGGTGAGSNYAATVNSGLSNGVPVADALATLIQTDGDSRIWSMTLSLNGVQDSGSELLTLSQSTRLAAHAAGINIISDGQTITLTGGATREAFQAVLSAIMYVNTANTPTGGIRTIAVTVNDDAISSATSSLTIITGSPPVVSTPVPQQSVAQNSNLSFTLPAGTFTDPDSDPLTLSATLADGSALPAWLNFDPVTGTFSGTPDNADVGSLGIKVTATDTARNSVSTTFNLTVTNVNDAPVVSIPIPLQAVWQDQSLSFTVPAGTFSDPDGDTLTLSATLTSGSALPTWLHFNPTTGTFSGTPGNADVGNLNIRLTATDPDNASVSTIFNLLVVNVNDAPVVSGSIPAQSVSQDSSLNFTVPAGTFVDPDGDTLTLNATLADGSALPTWLHFDPATNTFSGTPGNADVGNLSIKLTASDGNASVSTTFALTVVNVNDAPVVSGSIPAQSVAQDGSFSLTVPAGTFVDPDGDTLTLSATLADGSALPTWLHFDPATHTFTGTPGNSDVGSISIKVTANDGDASVSTTFSLTVINVNDAPVVSTPIPAQGVLQDSSLNFTVPTGTFSDPDGDTLTLSATLSDGSAMPSWLHFDPATNTFSGTPGNADVGNLSIKLTASDGDASVSTTFALTVINVNDAPVVSGSIPAQSVVQDGSFSLTVPAGTFVDPDGDTLTLSATLADGSAMPSWLHFDPATHTFTGTPGNSDVGSISIKVTANDGDASVSTTFSLTVINVNDAPVVSGSIPAQSVAQDGSFSLTVPAGTFVDPDGDTLTLNATLADGSALPTWLHFDPATHTFSGTPGNADVGILSVKLTATDPGNATASTTFNLFVVNVNDAPEVAIAIPTQSVAQDGSFSLTVPAGTFVDPDGDTLTLSATLADGSAMPSWLHFDPATNTFSGTPGNSDVGSISIKVTANDGDASVSTTFSLTVINVNDAPVVSTPIPAQGVLQDSSLNFTVPTGTFSDPDGDTLTLSATLSDGSALPTWLHFDPATHTFSGTPGNADVGILSVKLTATDPGNATASTTFNLFVVNVNDAPEVAIAIPTQSVAQDGSFSLTVPAGTFVDPDGDTLTLSATLADGSALPSWLYFDPATNTFSGTPGNADVGNLSIKLTASDGNASVSTTFALTVVNVNDAPVVSGSIPAQSVAQDSSMNFTVPTGTFSDPDGDTLTLSATLADGSALPTWLHFDPATNTFTGTPDNSDVGSISIKVTANDGDASVSTTFSLTVINVNDAPVVSTPIPAQGVLQDSSLNFTVPTGTFSDPDGDTLTLNATLADGSALPTWLHFDPATNTFSGTPGNADVGNLSIKLTASDGDASVSTTFALTVVNVNDAPVVSGSIPAQSVAQDGSFSLTVPAGTFVDPDGDTLTLNATLADGSALPTWLHFAPATNTFSGTPGNADVGNLSIKLTASDGDASVSTTFALTVINVNDAPVVSGSIPAQSVAQDSSLNFTVPTGTFSDPDGDTLTLSATLADGSALPTWLYFDPATNTFSGTPGNADVGNLSIKLTASDGNASVSTTFALTVVNVNDAPVVSGSIPAQSVAQDSSLNFTVPAGTFVDPDGDTLTLSATLADGSALPTWLHFDPATNTFSGTPGNADVGNLSIKLTATDPSNASVSTTFVLTITRADMIGGDPQFRITDGVNGPRPGDSHTPDFLTQGTGAPPLNTLFTPPTLGSFSAGRTAGSGSMMASIFNAGRDDMSGDDVTKSPIANLFERGSTFGSRFDSSLASFPSFSKDPALGGTSSLASVFSGIYLPSMTPMEVFTNGSWKDINLHSRAVTAQGTEHVAAAFTPSLHRQLQHIGEAEGQRLSAIEQALHDRGQQQG